MAAELLRSIVLLHPDNIPSTYFQGYAQTILGLDHRPATRSVNAALDCLSDFSLIHRTFLRRASDVGAAKYSFAIHRLFQAVIQFDMEPSEKRQRLERVISAMSYEMPLDLRPHEQFQKTMEIYVPHIQYLQQQWEECNDGPRDLKELSSMLLPTIIFLVRRALFGESEDLAKRAVANATQANGRDHPDTAAALSALFYHYAMQRDFVTAIPHGKRALDIRKKRSWDDRTRSSLHYLAFAHNALGEKAAAKSLYEEAAKESDGVAMLQLARIHYELKNYNAARALENELRDSNLQCDFY